MKESWDEILDDPFEEYDEQRMDEFGNIFQRGKKRNRGKRKRYAPYT